MLEHTSPFVGRVLTHAKNQGVNMSIRDKLIAAGKIRPSRGPETASIRSSLIDRGVVKPNPGMTPQQAYRALLADWYKGVS